MRDAPDLTGFEPVVPQRRRLTAPMVSLTVSNKNTILLNLAAVHALGFPDRVELLIHAGKRQLAIVPTTNPKTGYRVHNTRAVSSAAVFAALSAVQPTGRWGISILPGPIGIVDLDQPEAKTP